MFRIRGRNTTQIHNQYLIGHDDGGDGGSSTFHQLARAISLQTHFRSLTIAHCDLYHDTGTQNTDSRHYALVYSENIENDWNLFWTKNASFYYIVFIYIYIFIYIYLRVTRSININYTKISIYNYHCYLYRIQVKMKNSMSVGVAPLNFPIYTRTFTQFCTFYVYIYF